MAQFRDVGSTQGHAGGTCHVRHSAGEKASVSGQGAVKEGDVVNGRVLSEEDLLQTEQTWDAIQFVDVDYAKQTVRNLIATIRELRSRNVQLLSQNMSLAGDNVLMLGALERIANFDDLDEYNKATGLSLRVGDEYTESFGLRVVRDIARDTLAKVKGGDSQ
jgi:hypothetical protein